MAADNYGVCPSCLKKGDKDEQEIRDASTLRENFEVGIDEKGEFFVIYDGQCEVCKFGFRFRHTQDALESQARAGGSPPS